MTGMTKKENNTELGQTGHVSKIVDNKDLGYTAATNDFFGGHEKERSRSCKHRARLSSYGTFDLLLFFDLPKAKILLLLLLKPGLTQSHE